MLVYLGDIYIVPGAQSALTTHALNPTTFLDWHVNGDWSNLSPCDIKANRDALAGGACALSSYRFAPKVRIWVITEANRASSTILLPKKF